jgi:murein DD-endopeptidase MepM/ murein hydrolase activator NlpD
VTWVNASKLHVNNAVHLYHCESAAMMSVCSVRDHLQCQARDLRQNWFPERQLILRQGGSIRAIQLSSHSQLLAACIVVIGGVWTTTATTVCFKNLLRPTTSEVTPGSGQPRGAGTSANRGMVNLQDRTEGLERALAFAQQQLEDAQVQRQSVLQERDSMAARLADAEQHMGAATADQAEAVTRLTQETRKSIIEVERIFNAISIDPARLVLRGNTGGRGGPFVPWRDRASARSAAPLTAADAVALDVARLDSLTQILRTMPLAAPLEDFAITSPFGRRTDPFSGQRAMHEGIDLRAPLHTPVMATAPGRVVFAGRQGAYGVMVEIEHDHNIHTRYAHLDRITVALGQQVDLHQKIGLVGATGRASGPHVHYEIRLEDRPLDPLNFLKAASHVRNAAQ